MEAHVFIDDSQLNRLARLFQSSPELFQKAVRSTLRRVGSNMRKNVRKGVKGVSYLKSGDIASAFSRLKMNGMEVELTVAGSRKAAHKFHMVPNRITAKKGSRSVNWPSPGVKIGPGEPVKHPAKDGYSRPFIANVNGLKAMYWREKSSGKLKMPPVAAPQYFAAFDEVKNPVMSEAEQTFLKRLEHEIDYRLGLGR